MSQFYDNLIGKLVVWGHDRDVAIRRTLRALDETVVEGVATTIPADRAILEHPDFAAATHSTKWVEETLDLTGVRCEVSASDDGEPTIRRDLGVEVDGRRFAVSMWVPDQVAATRRRSSRSGGAGGSGDGASGEVTEVRVAPGDSVGSGDIVAVIG